ncbi:MAG: hypothetical protein JXA81_07410 [Sedimentisphaerales bacterium]|nr:hypothetical protein [Sedimentisphaerales bacterium]
MNGQTYGDLKHTYDSNKFSFDFFKHLTTLNTGVIILIATLRDKLFNISKCSCLMIVAMPSFLISLVGSVFMMYFVIYVMRNEEMYPGVSSRSKMPALVGTIISAGFFLLAMVCILVYMIVNLI